MQRIIHTIKAYQMIQPGMRVLAAVSGGADSVCLLVTLAGYRKPDGFFFVGGACRTRAARRREPGGCTVREKAVRST